MFTINWSLMCNVCFEEKPDEEFLVNPCKCNVKVSKPCFKTIENLDGIYKCVMCRTQRIEHAMPIFGNIPSIFLEPPIEVVPIVPQVNIRTAKRNWRCWFQKISTCNFCNSYWHARGNPGYYVIHNILQTEKFKFRTEARVYVKFKQAKLYVLNQLARPIREVERQDIDLA